ncbi:MAG: hypothetical protein HHJ12_15875 [Glaciimonas sp.]|nr:hypothetical protein [Glaciimonas sp.]
MAAKVNTANLLFGFSEANYTPVGCHVASQHIGCHFKKQVALLHFGPIVSEMQHCTGYSNMDLENGFLFYRTKSARLLLATVLKNSRF